MHEPPDLPDSARLLLARREEQLRLANTRIQAPEKQVAQRDERIQHLQARLEAVETENQDLERRLGFHKNPHTPSSRETLKPKKRQ